MIRYIKSSKADQLSNALWSLVRPDSIREDQDTQYLFGWITDTNGDGWLEAETDYTIRIHAEANLNKIATLMQPWVDEEILSSDDLIGLSDAVASHKASGEPLNVYDSFPQFFKDASKDRATMLSEGLISAPSMDSQQMAAPKPQAPRAKPR